MKFNFFKKLFFFLIVINFATGKTDCKAQNSFEEFNIVLNDEELNLETVLSKYIQFKSVSGSEKEAGEFIKDICIENDLFITQMGDEDGNYNFSASVRPLSENLPNIIFLNHIDVVPAGEEDKWTHPPYSGEIIGDDIWGRGAFDNKGAAIMQLASVIEISKQYANTEVPYNVTFLAVSCEETQCEGGVKYVVENYFNQLNPAVVIGEGPPQVKGILKSDPTAPVFGISVAHKRPFWLRLEIDIQTSGHGSITPLQYANKEMVFALNNLMKKKQKPIFNDLNVDLLKQLGELEKGIYGSVLKHPRFFKPLIVPKLRKQPEMFALFSNTITVTSIESNNNVVNVVPNKVTALLDCRLQPLELEDDFLKQLKKRLKNDNIKITVLNELPEVEPNQIDTFFYDNLKEAILDGYPNSNVIRVLLPSFNDVGVFRSKGIPGMSSIPVIIDEEYLKSIHTYNERVPLKILAQGKNVYVDFVKKCFN